MEEITSVNNDLVKKTAKLQQKKFRDETGKFLLEGRKCIEEAISANLDIEHIFLLKESFNNYKLPQERMILTTTSVLKKISTTESVPEIVAVARKKQFVMPQNTKKVVLLENIKDMGNLGTILRTSVAFGADAVVLYGKECADIFNPKCVRSAVGNLWKIPVIYVDKIEKLKKHFENFERIATLPLSKNYVKNFNAKEPILVMFGSEADGLSKELIDFSTNDIKIEMSKNVESLNLSVSCAVVLYKLFL